ncbi:MAG: glycerate kinase family protein [Actinomycetes bacterium]
MRILVAPDKFAGTLTATEAAAAIGAGWTRTAPDDELELVPLSDGGPGFLEVMHTSLGGELSAVTVTGPLGDRVPAGVLVHERTAYVESCEATGLHLVAAEDRDPERATSYGVGELIAAALDTGVRRVVVGLGGSATNDGGAGALAALGAEPQDRLREGGAELADLDHVDLDVARDRLEGVELVVATDVDAPLLGDSGATHGFATQKGADRTTRDRLEVAMRTWAGLTDGAVAVRPGAGAAGGLGAGLIAFLDARLVSGSALVLDAVAFDRRLVGADLVMTGEGRIDGQSIYGKLTHAVTVAARRRGIPVVAVAGTIGRGHAAMREAGIEAIETLAGDADAERDAAMRDPLPRIEDAAERLVRARAAARGSG